MNLHNPILIKEMRTRMRGKRAFLVLTGYVAVLSLIIGLIYIVFKNNAPTSLLNNAGKILTPVLVYVQMGLICLMAPTFSASAISSEREQETFDLLIASLAKPSTILFGKVGAALSYLVLTLFGSLPLIALTYSLGGVDLLDIARVYLVMFVAGVTYCSLSFLWSTLIRRGVVAQFVSLFTVIFLVAAMPALALFFSALASNFSGGPSSSFMNIVFLLLRTNPFAAIASLIPGFAPPQGIWLPNFPVWASQVLFYLLLAGLSLYFSLKRLESVRKWM
ncbi:MAG TPA: ABC transporter permease subunit [Blastocatellia bacterium]|jgi:ABC-type transport system involved in multi-copper enzyme maturation permease subunit|nr:ABC transporter permease subunit [Blastocatellia bacterium]